MTRIARWLVPAAAVCALACSSTTDGPLETTPPGTFKVALQVIDTVNNALYLMAPAGDSRLFVVLQTGVIRVIKNGVLLPTPFLDISSSVHADGQEQGLLSMAFHPDYASNGFFYVYFNAPGGTIKIQRYHANGNADVADATSAHPLLSFQQGIGNFGGLLAFGPDGKLYAGVGDGAGANTTGQDSSVYLGKLLRLDVDGTTLVPSDNPYAGNGHGDAKPEIWAKGLRNPWRYAFDNTTNRLYVADVGESRTEEVNVVASTRDSVNYGWPIMEGGECFPSAPCVKTGLQLPVVTYPHVSHERCAVIGGFVYRGLQLPEIRGHYFYSDVCASDISSFRYTTDSGAVDKITWNVGPAGGHAQSFGRDGAGELYFINNSGVVSKLVRDTTSTN